MGFFDFGTKAQVEVLTRDIGQIMQIVEEKMRQSSNKSTPEIRGIAFLLMDKKKQLVVLISALTQSTRDNLKVRYKNQKVSYFSFIHEMKTVSDKVYIVTGIDFFTETIDKR